MIFVMLIPATMANTLRARPCCETHHLTGKRPAQRRERGRKASRRASHRIAWRRTAAPSNEVGRHPARCPIGGWWPFRCCTMVQHLVSSKPKRKQLVSDVPVSVIDGYIRTRGWVSSKESNDSTIIVSVGGSEGEDRHSCMLSHGQQSRMPFSCVELSCPGTNVIAAIGRRKVRWHF